MRATDLRCQGLFFHVMRRVYQHKLGQTAVCGSRRADEQGSLASCRKKLGTFYIFKVRLGKISETLIGSKALLNRTGP